MGVKQTQSRHAVISCSGGMDSSCLLIKLLSSPNRYDKIHIFHFWYGQRHNYESKMLYQLLAHLVMKGYSDKLELYSQECRFTFLHNTKLVNEDCDIPEGHYEDENMKQTVVPNRNAIFASYLYSKAGELVLSDDNCTVDITLGVHAGDHAIYPDCRPQFYAALIHAFELGNYHSNRIKLYLPYIKYDKALILNDALMSCDQLNLDFDEVLGRTSTSYAPDHMGRASGKTASDVERVEAFLKLGRKDPIEYVMGWEKTVEYVRGVLKEKQ